MPPRESNIHLLLLTANYLKKVKGRKRLQKIVYLLKEKHGIPFTYRFVSYLYGPYCSQLQNEVNVLTRGDYLIASKIGDLYVYEITPLGKKAADHFEKEIDPQLKQKLRQRSKDLNELRTEELVRWSKKLMRGKVKDNIFA